MVDVRPYEQGDLAEVQRLWREAGWVEDDADARLVEPFLAEAATYVGLLDGRVQGQASIHRGRMLHTGTDLDTAVVSAVLVSRTARRSGVARTALGSVLAEQAEAGAAVAVLGMFEQGFYDTLGFGTGAEMLFTQLDPATLDAMLPYRRPEELTLDDAAEIAACQAGRLRTHGGVALDWPRLREAELGWFEHGFGLGYRDADGRLTHCLWASSKGEHGPMEVHLWAYETSAQLRELLGALRSLSDQIRTLKLPEPPHAQLQPLVALPGRQEFTRPDGPHAYRQNADAWWQARVLDVPSCVAALDAVAELDLDVVLTDPVDAFVPRGSAWSGVGGAWRLELRSNGSVAAPLAAPDGSRPTLRCSVNAFSRLWLGVRPPTRLQGTDVLEADDGLLAALERCLPLPLPDVGMDF